MSVPWVVFGVNFVCTCSNVFRGVVSRDLASTTRLHRCAQARNSCALVLSVTERDTMFMQSMTLEQQTPSVFQRAPRSQRQRDGPQLPTPTLAIWQVTSGWLILPHTQSNCLHTHHTHTDRPKKASDHWPPNTGPKVCCHTCGASPVPCIASTSMPQSCSNHLSRHRQEVHRKSLGSSRPRDRLT